MYKTIQWLLTSAIMLAALPAQAEVVILEKTMQKGLFSPPGCDGKEECLCESDIQYPAISGMKKIPRQDAINAIIEKSALQLKCQGKQVNAQSNGNNFSVSHRYEVTFLSPEILGLKFTDWAYEGGAHGNGSIEAMIIDVAKGNILSVNDLFGPDNIAAINTLIYTTLAPKSEGIFRDEVEGRKGNFIKDDKCQGCVLLINKEGVQVVFQAYEVAPFADGNPTISIPNQYIIYKPVIGMLNAAKNTH